MYVQFQFKSFHKIEHEFKKSNKTNTQTITSKNLFKFFIVLLIFKFNNVELKNETHTNNHTLVQNSVFHTPKKKKSVIFLRAPYKNKLARLNILNLEFTSIVSFKLNKKIKVIDYTKINILGNYLFSTHKLKHTKTKIKFYCANNPNFSLINFN